MATETLHSAWASLEFCGDNISYQEISELCKQTVLNCENIDLNCIRLIEELCDEFASNSEFKILFCEFLTVALFESSVEPTIKLIMLNMLFRYCNTNGLELFNLIKLPLLELVKPFTRNECQNSNSYELVLYILVGI